MPAAEELVSLIATNRMGHESNIMRGGGLKEKGMEEKKYKNVHFEEKKLSGTSPAATQWHSPVTHSVMVKSMASGVR